MKFTDDQGVIQAFMDQQNSKSKNLQTDGQSLFSFEKRRIAEHSTRGDGTATTLVYDYTYGGGAYVSQSVSNHVRLTKKKVPRQTWVSVTDAQQAGLVPMVIERFHNANSSNKS